MLYISLRLYRFEDRCLQYNFHRNNTHYGNGNQKQSGSSPRSPNARLTIMNRQIPTPGPGELIVRNFAIAANPADWKIQAWGFAIKKYPTILGSDCCGIITAISPSVTKFKVGDRVTGFAGVIYNSDINHGAWQTYTVLREIATTKIPDSMSFEEGSVFAMAFATCAIALFVNLGILRPTGSVKAQKKGFLIWGGRRRRLSVRRCS